MALNGLYVVGINIGEYFVDNATGLPLAGGTISFYRDEARTVPKLVYALTGSPPNYTYTALPNPITLSSVGTIVDANGVNVAVYYYPYNADGEIENYYIVVKNSSGVVQLQRQAWPNISASTSPSAVAGTTNNEISNSQFPNVFFNPENGVTISFAGPVTNAAYPIAPDWNLVVSSNGAGSVIVNRIALIAEDNIITNPPFALDILPTGASVTSLRLVQRLPMNPGIWANHYLSGSVVATSLDGFSHTITATYAPSGDTTTTIFAGTTVPSEYTVLSGVVLLGQSASADTGDDGYADIIFTLPITGHVALTSVQAALSEDGLVVPYYQDTINRQQDYLAHYYMPLLQAVPVPSISEGWDFRVNPFQLAASTPVGAVAARYVADQTIIWQSVNNAVTGSKGSPNSLQVAVGTTCQLAVLQYLSGSEMVQLLTNYFSMVIKARGGGSVAHSGTVSIWVTSDPTLPSMNSNLCLINTIDAFGKPATFNGNWTEIPRNYRGNARFTIPAGSEMTEIPLEGWNSAALASIATYNFAAIVIGFESVVAPDTIVFESISVTPGILAVPFAPLSFPETLKKLEYFIEKSYPQGVYAGAITANGRLERQQVAYSDSGLGANTQLWIAPFDVPYRQKKIKDATCVLYSSESGVENAVHGYVENWTPAIAGSTLSTGTHWPVQTFGQYGCYFTRTAFVYSGLSVGGGTPPGNAFIVFHYIANASYGIS